MLFNFEEFARKQKYHRNKRLSGLSQPHSFFNMEQILMLQKQNSYRNNQKVKSVNKFAKKCEQIYEQFWFHLLVNVCTLWILLADYCRVIFFTTRADVYFNMATIFCLFVFIFEIAVYLNADPNYPNSFFF